VVNFTELSDKDLIQFVDEHFDLFASKRDEDFPNAALRDIERDACAIVRRAEGFAIAFKGRRNRSGLGGFPADLLFLHVLPECQKNGIGSALFEEIKASVTPGLPITLTCEGARRKGFFQRLNFVVTEHWENEDVYAMRWDPTTSDAAGGDNRVGLAVSLDCEIGSRRQ
jgi:GNAT superfamily N-acetyltransferase